MLFNLFENLHKTFGDVLYGTPFVSTYSVFI